MPYVATPPRLRGMIRRWISLSTRFATAFCRSLILSGLAGFRSFWTAWRGPCGSFLLVLRLGVPSLRCLVGTVRRCEFLTLLPLLRLRLLLCPCPCLRLRPRLWSLLRSRPRLHPWPLLRRCRFRLHPRLQLHRFSFPLRPRVRLRRYRFCPHLALLRRGPLLCLRRLVLMRMSRLPRSQFTSILRGLLPPPLIASARPSCLLRSGSTLTPPNAAP